MMMYYFACSDGENGLHTHSACQKVCSFRHENVYLHVGSLDMYNIACYNVPVSFVEIDPFLDKSFCAVGIKESVSSVTGSNTYNQNSFCFVPGLARKNQNSPDGNAFTVRLIVSAHIPAPKYCAKAHSYSV